MLLFGRALQGLGASGIQNLTRIVLSDNVTLADNSKNNTIFSLVSGISYTVGPVIGGYLAAANWRYCFVVSIPIAVLAHVLIFWVMRKHLVKGRVSRSVEEGRRTGYWAGLWTFDWPGIFIFFFGVWAFHSRGFVGRNCVFMGFCCRSFDPHSWTSPPVAVLLPRVLARTGTIHVTTLPTPNSDATLPPVPQNGYTSAHDDKFRHGCESDVSILLHLHILGDCRRVLSIRSRCPVAVLHSWHRCRRLHSHVPLQHHAAPNILPASHWFRHRSCWDRRLSLCLLKANEGPGEWDAGAVGYRDRTPLHARGVACGWDMADADRGSAEFDEFHDTVWGHVGHSDDGFRLH